jgi:hypothetical protein
VTDFESAGADSVLGAETPDGIEFVFYPASGDFTAEEFLKYIRGHWSIENRSH